MPIVNYSVLKGQPVSGRIAQGNSPHYRIGVSAEDGRGGTTQIEVDVNIQSADGSMILYLVDHAFVPPMPDGLLALPAGLTPLDSHPGGLALDYVRSMVGDQPMVSLANLTALPATHRAGGRHNDLNNEVVDLLNRAIADKNGTIYAFGSSFADPNGTRGIHDIHMNQGNPPRHAKDNGVWQDGAIFMNLPATETWIAVFLAFMTEGWQTDDTTGNPVQDTTQGSPR